MRAQAGAVPCASLVQHSRAQLPQPHPAPRAHAYACRHTHALHACFLCVHALCVAVLRVQAPRGAFIIPDIVSACRQGYTEGESFDPDRFR